MREYSHAQPLVSELPDGFGGECEPDSAAKGDRAGDDKKVAPPTNEKSNPVGLLRSLRCLDKKDATHSLFF